MSEDESISSEDIQEHSGSGSETFNPYSEDEELPPASNKVQQHLSKSVKHSKAEEMDYSYSFDEFNDNDLEPSRGYTDDFELEQSAKSQSYSTDFDVSQSISKSVQWHKSTLIKEFNDNNKHSIHIPTADMQSIQAELALQELGKEVIRLRNQQREVLRQRRLQTREKKLRAEDRRAKYMTDFQDMTIKFNLINIQNQELVDCNKALQSQIEALQETKTILQNSLEISNKTINEQHEKITQLYSNIEDIKHSNEEKDVILKESEEKWTSEKIVLREKITKLDFQLEVIRSGLDAAESRLLRDRDTLPEHYKNVLQEQSKRLIALEGELKEKEGVLRAQEHLSQIRLDAMRKENIEEAQRIRSKAYEDIADERASLVRLQASISEERTQYLSQLEKGRLDVESRRIETVQRETSLERAERDLARRTGDFEARLRQIEPNIRGSEEELQRARTEREEVRQMRVEVEQRLSSVLDVDNVLRQREKAIEQSLQQIETEGRKINNEKLFLTNQTARLLSNIKASKTERLGLQQVSLELARQMGLLRKAVSWFIRNNGKSQSQLPRGEQETLDSILGQDGTVVEDDGGDENRYGTSSRGVSMMTYGMSSLVHALIQLDRAADALCAVAAQLVPPTNATSLSDFDGHGDAICTVDGHDNGNIIGGKAFMPLSQDSSLTLAMQNNYNDNMSYPHATYGGNNNTGHPPHSYTLTNSLSYNSVNIDRTTAPVSNYYTPMMMNDTNRNTTNNDYVLGKLPPSASLYLNKDKDLMADFRSSIDEANKLTKELQATALKGTTEWQLKQSLLMQDLRSKPIICQVPHSHTLSAWIPQHLPLEHAFTLGSSVVAYFPIKNSTGQVPRRFKYSYLYLLLKSLSYLLNLSLQIIAATRRTSTSIPREHIPATDWY
eukprot:gene4252-8455_t